MPTEADVYRALIASPSDVQEERKIARNVIIKWNGSRSKQDVYLEPVMWETHVAPDLRNSPQKTINKQIIDTCDLVIGMFWKRIGTETENERGGAVEEINHVLDDDNPAIVGFSEKPIPPSEINSEQYGKLMEFREECEENGLVFTYDSVEEFRHRLTQHLAQTMSQIIDDRESGIKFSRQTEREDSGYDASVDHDRLELQADVVYDQDKQCIESILDYLGDNNVEPPYRVFDAGCGYGNLTKRLFGDDDRFEVRAVDKSENTINVAKNEYSANNLSYEIMNLEEIFEADLPDFDIIYSTFVFHHLKNQESILANLWDMLDPDAGAFLLRSVDDGLHMHYPPDEDLNYLIEMCDSIEGSADRTHGRRIYTQMKRLNPEPTNVKLNITNHSTAGLNRRQRKRYFDVFHSYRVYPAKRLAERSDATEDDRKLFLKMKKKLDRVEQRFIDNPNLLDAKFIPLAVAYR